MTRAVISGVAQTHLGELPELTDIGICVRAATDAVADAGLTMRDIDGLLVQPPFWASPRYHMLIGESLGIYVKTLTDATSMGGASYGAMLQFARWAIEDGLCKNVLVVAGEKLRTGHSSGAAMMASVGAHNLDWEYPFCATIPAYYGLLAQRYLHEYGLADDAIAPVAVTTRKHAALNPAATMRTPLTLQDVLDSPMISTPLRRLECSLVSDGGAAWVISREGTSGDPAREVGILGLGSALSHYHMGHLARGDGTGHGLVRTVVDVAGRRAFEQARLTPAELDLAMIYDSFTVTVVVQLEDLGLVPRGESGAYLNEGRMDLGGELPLNTHGGLLSYGHCGVGGALAHLVEAHRQMTGRAGERQVGDAALALAHGDGGVMSSHVSLILEQAR
jgi:acetyl-CoA acetyltransferase